jgi:hypothetical protein
MYCAFFFKGIFWVFVVVESARPGRVFKYSLIGSQVKRKYYNHGEAQIG